MSGLAPRPGAPELTPHIELIGDCLLAGRLYDFGPYPCLVPGNAHVRAELWRPISHDALAILDRWEEHDPQSLEASVYVRREARLLEPELDAWVYYWNRSTAGLAVIADGDWRAHSTGRSDRTPPSTG
jgi:gamma-glutamylcyclotransferase (GGCT)/AIG2-like uncharacterized protein YtfP